MGYSILRSWLSSDVGWSIHFLRRTKKPIQEFFHLLYLALGCALARPIGFLDEKLFHGYYWNLWLRK